MHPRQAEAAFKEYIQRAGESDERAGIDAQMEVRSQERTETESSYENRF